MIKIARTPRHLSEIIRGYRRLGGMAQEKIAARVGIKQATVSAFEADAAHARIETLYKLLDALGIEVVIRKRGARLRSRGPRFTASPAAWPLAQEPMED